MAITLITTPPRFVAANNQIAYTISSDNTAQPNFNFIIDVFVVGATTSPAARLSYPVQPSSIQLTFDISEVIKNYVSFDLFNVTAAIIAPNTNSRAKYYCEFRELYDVAGVPTLSAVLASDPTTPGATTYKHAYNAIFDFEDFSPSAFITNYRVNENGWMNNQTITNYIMDLDYKVITFFDPDRIVYDLQIDGVYASEPITDDFMARVAADAGTFEASTCLITQLDEWNATNYVKVLTETANEYLFNINANYYDPTNISSYNVILRNSGGTTLATYELTADDSCSKYETIRLHWMSKAGCFETYNFRYVTRHNENIDRAQFKAPLQINYAKSDRLKTNYQTIITDKYTLNTDWITDAEAVFFEELLTSPVIFWEKTGEYIAINVIDVTYETKKYVNDKSLFNLSIEIEPTYNRYRQQL